MNYRRQVVSTVIMLVATCYVNSFGFTRLAGDMPDVISADQSPYLVEADIFVPAGKSVRVESGVVFLFNNFTGVHVRGVLVVKGTALHPVVFTSANDHAYSGNDSISPTPYDWNGIYIQKDGMGTDMEYFKVLYSVKGIVSETKFINLTSGIFSENGRSHCIIEGVEQQLTAGEPFSHAVSVKDATVDGVPIRILHDPQAFKRNILRYSGLTCLVGGVALGGFFGVEYHESQSAFTALQSRDTSNTIWKGSEVWETARNKRNRDRSGTIVGAILAVIGSAGFFWTFTF